MWLPDIQKKLWKRRFTIVWFLVNMQQKKKWDHFLDISKKAWHELRTGRFWQTFQQPEELVSLQQTYRNALDTAKRGNISGRSLTCVGFLFFFSQKWQNKRHFLSVMGSQHRAVSECPLQAPLVHCRTDWASRCWTATAMRWFSLSHGLRSYRGRWRTPDSPPR